MMIAAFQSQEKNIVFAHAHRQRSRTWVFAYADSDQCQSGNDSRRNRHSSSMGDSVEAYFWPCSTFSIAVENAFVRTLDLRPLRDGLTDIACNSVATPLPVQCV